MEPLALQIPHVRGNLYANRDELIANISLPANPVIAEIGVAFGDGSRMMMDIFKPREFHAFDTFDFHTHPVIWGTPSDEIFKGKNHLEFYTNRVANEFGFSNLVTHIGPSAETMSRVPPATFDLIYIDGDHTLEGVQRDAEVAVRAVKPDGVLVFNDYVIRNSTDGAIYGIVPVVNELCVNGGWTMIGLGLHWNMNCDVALKRASALG